MKIIDNLGDFIEKIESTKKANRLDVSSDEDLSIAIMNLISIEEHLFFSGAKTQDSHFYDMIEEIRECRKELLGKIIKSYRGEVWCISKHLLASCMRLMEVGTKCLHSDRKNEAYDFFEKAYSLYCLFWGLNLESFDEETARKLISEVDRDTLDNIDGDNDSSAGPASGGWPSGSANGKPSTAPETGEGNRKSLGTRLRNFVAKVLDCCRE
ncbi:MAG: hypothetical protein LBU15_03460 [Rickettsiales bacterium]|jgi:hypothetical protein|nr:hypothetical protein [Rickettsiales bacterium]